MPSFMLLGDHDSAYSYSDESDDGTKDQIENLYLDTRREPKPPPRH